MIDIKMYRITRMLKRIENYDKQLCAFKRTYKTMLFQRNKQKKKLNELLRDLPLAEFIKLGINQGYLEQETRDKYN